MYVRVVLRAFIELVDGFVWDIHATSMRAAIALMATRRSRNTTASISIRIGHTHCCAPRLGVITHELHCHTDAARRAHPLPAVFGIVCQCARVLIRTIARAHGGGGGGAVPNVFVWRRWCDMHALIELARCVDRVAWLRCACWLGVVVLLRAGGMGAL